MYIDPDFGLLDKLLGNGTLTSEEYYNIRGKGIRVNKNESLVYIVFVRDLYHQFLGTLNEDNQSHIVNYIYSKWI